MKMNNIYKVRVVYVDDNDETMFKPLYLDSSQISSFLLEEPIVVEDEEVKCYGIVCGGYYFSVYPDPNIYKFLYDKFINYAIK